MNKDRRKRIAAIAELLEKLVLPDLNLEDVKSDVEGIRDEEQETYDNMPESFQNGERGEKAQEAVGYLESAVDELDELIEAFNKIDSIVENLRNAEGV